MTDDLNSVYLEQMVNRSRYHAPDVKHETVADVESLQLSPRSPVHERPISPQSVSLSQGSKSPSRTMPKRAPKSTK